MRFDIVTIFPDIFDSYFNTSIIKRAQQKKIVRIFIHNLRQWSRGKHQTVDDRPYGGGPGMILKIEPLYRAISSLIRRTSIDKRKQIKIILLTPDGKQFNQKMAGELSKLKGVVLVCGRYEGFDERIKKFVDKKISVGPYVLTGGEIPAMIIVDAVTRLMPGVINSESLEQESGTEIKNWLSARAKKMKIVSEYPQYTRPEVFTYKNKSGIVKTLKVPRILLSGKHSEIQKWRKRKCSLTIE